MTTKLIRLIIIRLFSNRYLSSISWVMSEKIVRMIFNFFVVIYVARTLGAEDFGVLSYCLSIVGLLLVFGSLGLEDIVVKSIVNSKNYYVYLGTAITLRFIGCVFIIIVSIIYSYFHQSWKIALIIFILALSNLFRPFSVIEYYYKAHVLGKWISIANFFSFSISSFLKVIFCFYDFGLIYVAAAYALEALFLAVAYIFSAFYTNLRLTRFRFDFKTAVKLLYQSWPLIFSGFVISIYMKIDQVMIGQMLSSAEVGKYAIAVKLSEVWYMVPIVITSTLFPAILDIKNDNPDKYKLKMLQLYSGFLWFSMFISVLVTLFSELIIKNLLGSDFVGSSIVLSIHIWTSIFVFLGVASGKWLVAEGLQIYSLYRACFGALLNVFLNFLLIPKYGIIGAAIATLVAQASSSYIFSCLSYRTREVFFQQTNSLLYPFVKWRNFNG